MARRNMLIHILLDEKKLGRWAESGWTSESYTKVIIALKAVGYARTAKQVKGCWTQVCHVISIFLISDNYLLAEGPI
jgi:hypothetical protein